MLKELNYITVLVLFSLILTTRSWRTVIIKHCKGKREVLHINGEDIAAHVSNHEAKTNHRLYRRMF